MSGKVALGVVIGLIVGLAVGCLAGTLFISPLLNAGTGAGVNNQVQVSGSVNGKQTGTITFTNSTTYYLPHDNDIYTSAKIVNGQYSVSLVGGESYTVVIESPNYSNDYQSLYVPSGVNKFTANF